MRQSGEGKTRRWVKAGIRFLLLAAVICSCTAALVWAQSTKVKEEEKLSAAETAADTRYSFGDADIKVLEIVPVKAMGEIGYLAAGSEPVAMEDYNAISDPQEQNEVKEFLTETLGSHKPETKMDLNLTADPDGEGEIDIEIDWIKREVNKLETGYFWMLTEENTAETESYRSRRNYVRVPSEGGEPDQYDFKEIVNGVIPEGAMPLPGSVGEGEGEPVGEAARYVWVRDSSAKDMDTDYSAEKVYLTNYRRTDTHFEHKTRLVNKELLKTEVLGIAGKDRIENTDVKVVTVSPKEINHTKYQNLIDEADLIYINGTLHDYRYVKYYEEYSAKYDDTIKYTAMAITQSTQFSFYNLYSRKNGDNYSNYVANDLSWDAVMKIYNRVLNKESAIILDDQLGQYSENADFTNLYEKYILFWQGNRRTHKNTANNNNVYKLFLMLTLMPVESFDRIYGSSIKTYHDKDTGLKTGELVYSSPEIPYIQLLRGEGGALNKINGNNVNTRYWSRTLFFPQYQSSSKMFDDKKRNHLKGIDDEYLASLGILKNEKSESYFDMLTGPFINENVFLFESTRAPEKKSDSSITVQNPKRGTDLPFSVKGLAKNVTTKQLQEVMEEDQKITLSDAMKYACQFEKPVSTIKQDKLIVLELEPCNDFNNSIYMEEYIREKLPGYQGDIEIVQQTTAEFIGKTENLTSTYDIIYIGANIGMFYLDKIGNYKDDSEYYAYLDGDIKNKMYAKTAVTSYNDTELNQKIYLHVGDQYYINDRYKNMPGLTIDDTQSTRFSGNDITKKKLNELMSFVNARYPVLIEDCLMEGTGANATYLDTSSYMYQFIDNAASGAHKNVVSADVEEISFENQSPVICKYRFPEEYQQGDTGKSNEGGKISYSFWIEDDLGVLRDHTYQARLYVDVNGDGTFSNDEIVQTREHQVPISGKQENETDEEYEKRWKENLIYIERELKAYIGIVSWKLEIVNEVNANIISEERGYARISDGKTKYKLSILQLKHSIGSYANMDLANLSQNYSAMSEYSKNLADFEIKFTSITITDKNKTKKFVFNEAKDENKYNLNNYDMIVIGFGDMIPDISQTDMAPYKAIYQFVQSGKNIFFAHDSSFSAQRYRPSEEYWGIQFTKYFRNLFGMDRYGISLTESAMQGTIMDGYYDKNSPYRWSGGDTTFQEFYQYTAEELKAMRDAKDIAYGVDGAGVYAEMQGFNNLHLISNSGNSSLKDNYDTNSGNEMLTNKVRKQNDGQITNYPYKIEDEFTVADTHYQYFELDLEKRTENAGRLKDDSDLVVWYCLASSKTSNNYYDISPNDTRNNYYIYNKGNITYTGVGHSGFFNNDMEVKLFINTIVSSYRPPIVPPEITILNAFTNTASDPATYYYYGDYDIDTAESSYDEAAEKVVDVIFRADDKNILSEYLTAEIQLDGIAMEYDIYNLGFTNDTDIEMDDKKTYEKLVPENSVYTLRSGYTYCIKVPVDVLKGLNNKEITISVRNIKDKEGKCGFTLLRRTLFNLD